MNLPAYYLESVEIRVVRTMYMPANKRGLVGDTIRVIQKSQIRHIEDTHLPGSLLLTLPHIISAFVFSYGLFYESGNFALSWVLLSTNHKPADKI